MNKASPVAIAGAGIISAIGNNTLECLLALEQGQAGMDDISWLDTAHRRKIPVAEVKSSNPRLAELAGIPASGSQSLSRTSLLSLIAAREALENASIPGLATWRTGFISANTVGGMDRTEKFFADPRKGPSG